MSGRRSLRVLLACLAAAGGLWLFAAAVPVPGPAGLHHLLPLPAACVDARCVTYRRWARLAERVAPDALPARVLTELLTSRASSLVSRRAGLSVTETELAAARSQIEAVLSTDEALRAYVAATYGDTAAPGFRDGLRDLLLRQKLGAAGVSSVWTHPASPVVSLLTFRYGWDARTNEVRVR